jgi:hypothetical protein
VTFPDALTKANFTYPVPENGLPCTRTCPA